MHEDIARFVHPVLEHGLGLRRRLESGEALAIRARAREPVSPRRPPAWGEAPSADPPPVGLVLQELAGWDALAPGPTAALTAEQAILKDLICREPEEPERRAPLNPGWLRPDASQAGGSPSPNHRVEDVRYALTCWLDELFILSSPWGPEWTESKLEASLFGSNDRAWRFWELAIAAELQPRPDVLEVFYLCVALGFRGELAERPDLLRAWLDRARCRLVALEPEPGLIPVALEPPSVVPPLHGRNQFRSMMILAGAVALLSIPALALILMSW